MSRSLAAAIAWRYLKAKKSHGAVSAIAIVSIVGVAVATAAIVCVLSVFNGFRGILGDKFDILAPDIVVTPAEGKAFASADSLCAVISGVNGVEIAMPAVSDNALAVIGTAEMPILVKGVDPALFRRITQIDSIFLEEGKFDLGSVETEVGEDEYGEPIYERRASAVISIGTAAQTGFMLTSSAEPILLFAPRREGRVNMANPLNSFLRDSVSVSGVFQSNQAQYDENLVITDLPTARHLLEYESEATSIEIKTKPGADYASVVSELEGKLGPKFVVRDRMRIQETNFRMVEIEKWVTFLLLFFILIIASFNIISTLSMLVLEKQPSMQTLHSLGLSRAKIGAVFGWESIYVTLIGGGCGMVLGVILSLLQEKFGFIKLNGDPSTLIMASYPVELHLSDLGIVAVPIVVIGLLTAWIASSFARSRVR